jgi:hypothetical protein
MRDVQHYWELIADNLSKRGMELGLCLTQIIRVFDECGSVINP